MLIATNPSLSAFTTNQPNRGRIYNLILSQGKISRQGIAQTLGLSLPTVNQYLDILFNAKLIVEDGLIASQYVGRKAKAITVNPTARIALGMDVTWHHFSLVAVDLCGHVINSLAEQRNFVNNEECYAYMGERINGFIRNNHWDTASILGLGISLPSIVLNNGTYADPIKTLDDATDFYDRIGKYCTVPHRLFNDANAGGYSEIYNRHNINRLVYLSLSHSIGSAIIEDNQIIEGNNCRGGEFGHMTIIPNGVLCHCGQRGCANGYCSPDVLAAVTGGDLDLFFRRLAEGDGACVKAFDTYLDYLAILIHNIRMIFDCDIVIGGMSRYINQYFDVLRERVRVRDSFDQSPVNYIKYCVYPFDASAVGAALFYIAEFIRGI